MSKMETGIRDYAEGKGLDNTRKKTLQLLHYVGMEVQDIFQDITDPDPVNDNQDPYAMCIEKLDHHFRAEENIPFERHVFRQMAPNEEEPVDKYLVRLRQQARHCNFGAAFRRTIARPINREVNRYGAEKEIVGNKENPFGCDSRKSKSFGSGQITNAVYDIWNECKCHRKQRRKGRGRRDISLGILVQQKEESVQSL